MTTVKSWMKEIKASPEKMTRWLSRQYIGEARAVTRLSAIMKMGEQESKNNSEALFTLGVIRVDEAIHARLIKELLRNRQIPIPDTNVEDERYWKPIEAGISSFDEAMAAGFHAETMRLKRIEALAFDEEIPQDIAKPSEGFSTMNGATQSGFALIPARRADSSVTPFIKRA